jgi:hypothetical protein
VHHIADVRLALEGAFDVPESAATDRDAGSRSRRRWIVLPAAAMALAAVAYGGAAYFAGGTGSDSRPISVHQTTFRQGNVGDARFASDGEVIVYGAAWDGEPYALFTTRVGGFRSRPIDLPPGDLLAMSASNTLALALARPAVDGFVPRGRLAEVPLAGGAPRVIAGDVGAVDYGPDGRIAALVRYVAGEALLEFPVGTVVRRSGVIVRPRVSPDGSRVCFGDSWGSVMVAERASPARVLIDGLSRVSACAWSDDGTEVWFTYSPTGSTHANLEAIEIVTGERRVVTALTGWASLLDLRSPGVALLKAGTMRFSVRGAASLQADERDLSVFDATRVGHLSASGKEIVLLDNSTGAQDGNLFLSPMDGSSAAIQLGVSGPLAIPLAISPDGAWVAVLGDGETSTVEADSITLLPVGVGRARTIRLPVLVRHGTGNVLGTNVPEFRTADFSDDGRRLLIPSARDGDRPPRVFVHDFEAGWTKAITPEDSPGEAALSPDGRFVASSRPDGLFVYDVETGDRSVVPGGPDPGSLVRWSSAPNVVYMVEQDAAAVTLVTRDLVSGERRPLREIRAAEAAGVTRFDVWVSRDGNAYAYSLDRTLSNLFVVEGLR